MVSRTLVWRIQVFLFCLLQGRAFNLKEDSNGPSTEDYGTTLNPQAAEIEKPAEYNGGSSSKGAKAHRLAFLDTMLEGYDKRAWPTYGTGKSTLVTVNVYVNSIGSISAANMEYGMDIYLRQSWVDERLKLPQDIKEPVTLNGEIVIDRIWKPDLFFRNVKQANFHMVTVPNKLIKMFPNGEILFSMRLTLRLACHMTFRKYPLDTQHCHLVIGPYAQTIDHVVVKWKEGQPIMIEQPVELPEFDLVKYFHGNFTRVLDTGSFSFVNATFILVRQNGYHLIQTYLPTFLIVTLSWVSFWLNVDAVPARVTLGVTTLLTLMTVASGVRTQLPPVAYVKAIDVWIGVCSVMVFGALLEFTLVNYLSRSKLKPQELKKSLAIFNVKSWVRPFCPTNSIKETTFQGDCKFRGKRKDDKDEESKESGEKPDAIDTVEMSKAETIKLNLKRARNTDRICRVLFPTMFFIFNVAYWPYYLYL